MFEASMVGPVTAAAIYLFVALRLVVGGQSGGPGRPAVLMGVVLALTGASPLVSYATYLVPGLDVSWAPLGLLLGRVAFDVACVVLLLFLRTVLQPAQATWNVVTGLTVTCLLLGQVPTLGGDWVGYMPLSNPWFWPECVGQLIPFAWAGVLMTGQTRRAARRKTVGLTPALVVHRLRLWSTFLWLQVALGLCLVPGAIFVELEDRVPFAYELATGALNVAAAGAIWLAFHPPAFVRRRLEAGAPGEAAEVLGADA